MRYDLVLVFPDIPNGRFSSFRKHLGGGYLLAYLKERGIRGTFYCQPGTRLLSRAAEEILALGPRWVGFTCFDANFYYNRLLARQIKALAPEVEVLFGGPSATFSCDLILKNTPEIDVCFKGMAEEPLAMYLEASESDKLSTPNLVFRDGDEIVHNPSFRVPGGKSAADQFPSPYLSGIFDFSEAPHLGLLSSRGCFYRCTFCNFSAMGNWRIQFHSAERVLDELRGVHDVVRRRAAGDRRPHMVFYDDFFTAGRGRMDEICRGIVDEGMPEHMTFKCCTRADWVDREGLRTLREAGFSRIVFGLESGSPEILRRVRKLYPSRPKDARGCEPESRFLDQFRETVHDAKKLGFEVYSSVIFGLPGETPEDARRTVDFVESLGLTGYNHNFLQVFPGTELFENARQYGIEVRPSQTLLPYLTYYTYDVTRVPVVDGLQGNIRTAREQMAGDLARCFFPQPEHLDRQSPVTVSAELDGLGEEHGVWSWLERNVTPLTRLAFRQHSCEAFRPEDVYPRLIRSSIPIVNYLSLYPPDEAADGELVCEDIRRGTRSGSSVLGMEVRQVSAAEMIPVWDRLLDGGAASGTFYRTRVMGACDLGRLADFLARRAVAGRLPLSRGFLDQGQQVTNACQYGTGTCPARRAVGLPTVVLDQGGNVRPCAAGPVIGGCDASTGELKRAFDRLYAARREQRDCEHCGERDACSGCPSFDCTPIRNGTVAPRALPFLETLRHRRAVRALWARSGGRLELLLGPLAFHGHGAGHGLDGLPRRRLTFTDGETYYLIDLDDGEIYEFNRTMVEILEGFARHVSEEEMVDYFTVNYGVDRQAASGSLDAARDVFTQLFQAPAAVAAPAN